MAKKKKKGPQANTKATATDASPKHYIRQAARKLPIYKCYITDNWQEFGTASVIVSRINPRGDIVAGFYLVDALCLGVKDAFCIIIDEAELNRRVKGLGACEVDYTYVHNLILGAIEFAEEAGIQPHKDFELAQYVLSEDTDDIELIQFDYGMNGKHHLVIGPDGTEAKYLDVLNKNLDGNFIYDNISEMDDDEDYEYESYPELEHSYDYPEYPSTPQVKNPQLLDILYNPDAENLQMSDIDTIMAIPYAELSADLDQIVRYEIGRTYRAIADGQADEIEWYHALRHCLAIICAIAQPTNFETVHEILRQTDDFVEEHLGYEQDSLLPLALVRTCGNDPSKIENILDEYGMQVHSRDCVLIALMNWAKEFPDMRYEIMEIFRRIILKMIDRLPETDRCNPLLAGFLLDYLSDLNAVELMPEIRALISTGYVDAEVIGSPEEYFAEFGQQTPDSSIEPFNIYDYYNEE